MSFTAGSIFFQESIKFAELYLEFGDWDETKNHIIHQNILQARTLNTSKRICVEIISRLKTMNVQELKFLVESGSQDQAYLLWLAICRRYKFIGDFAIEIIRERFITLKTNLNYIDFDCFFNQKSEWDVELDKIQPTTKVKLRQVLFKMLREVDLLTKNNIINVANLSPALIKLICNTDRREILYYPIFDFNLNETIR
jgi:predicted mannosyl-3-phosphoglycerate phosphatase (HAD superfamily)